MIIIGLTGRARSGKDTFFRLMRDALNGHADVVKRISFADALKRQLANASGISVRQAEIDKERWRPVWQWWGTEIMRHYYGPNYWVDLALDTISPNTASIWVVTDVRFKSEADAIRARGGYIFRIERPESWTKKIASMFLRIFRKEHRSETELRSIPVDAVIRQTDYDGLKREARRLAGCISGSESAWLQRFQDGK